MSRFLLFFLLFPIMASAQLAIPEQGGYWVHDEANILSSSGKAEIETIIRAERDSTSNQIGVLIIPSLNDEILEEYSLRVAEQWKIGQKGKDNGVLLLIVMKERKIRMESGYGMEGTLTDALSSRINRNEIAPHFQQGDYDGGVKAGVIAITQAVKGEYKNDDPAPRKKSSRRSPLATIIIVIIIIIIAARRNRRGGGGYWSSGGGFMGPMGGFGGSGGSDGGGYSGGDFGGGGGFGGGGSSDSW